MKNIYINIEPNIFKMMNILIINLKNEKYFNYKKKLQIKILMKKNIFYIILHCFLFFI